MKLKTRRFTPPPKSAVADGALFGQWLNIWFCRYKGRCRYSFVCVAMFLGICSQHAQVIEFCGVFPQHTASSSDPDSIYYDRFGNSYDIVDQWNSNLAALQPGSSCQAGYVVLNFGPGISSGLEAVFCEVFEDLSNLIPRRVNEDGCEQSVDVDPIIVDVKRVNPSVIDDALMAASSIFQYPPGHSCNAVVLSNFEKAVLGSQRQFLSSLRAGEILVNNSISNWHTSASNPPNDYYDAYSIILHEALHLYGFHSLHGYGMEGGLSRWDSRLCYTPSYNPSGPSSSVESLFITDCMTNCWEVNTDFADFEEVEDALIVNCSVSGSVDFIYGSGAIAPIAGKDNNVPPDDEAELRNIMSHLQPTCNGQNVAYVMQSFIDDGVARRTITDAEEEILCTLGYEIDACDECYVVAHSEDNWSGTQLSSCCEGLLSGCVGEVFEISYEDILCNDFGNSSLSLIDFWRIGSPVFSITEGITGISFTPTTTGKHRIGYSVLGCDCQMMNGAITVFVGPCTDCEEIDPCESLICLRDFEEYTSGTTGDIEIHLEAAGLYWGVSGGDNTPDVCEDSGGNNFLHIGGHSDNREGLAMKFLEPVQAGCTILVDFDASSGLPNVFSWMVSDQPPCSFESVRVSPQCEPIDCGSYVYNPVCIRDIPVSMSGAVVGSYCSNSPDLQSYQFMWENNLGYSVEYIILFPGANNVDIRNYIDNIVVTKKCIDADFDYEIIEECDEIEFTSHDQNGSHDHDWDFGDSGTSTQTNPSHLYLDKDTYTVTHTVTDACGNSETVTHDVTAGGCCDDFTVTANVTWSSGNPPPQEGIFHTLTVQHGSTLTIEDEITLKFCQGGSLVVEDGAFVRCRGKLTSLDDFDWLGVYVEGIPNIAQQANCGLYGTAAGCQPQGFFWADGPDALIENAIIGVRNHGLSPGTGSASSGGMIRANEATFRNNSIGVYFAPYQNFNPADNQPLDNYGKFTECEFTNTASLHAGMEFQAFARLVQIDGIEFKGCTFDSDLYIGITHSFEDYGIGVHADGATFEVIASATVPSPPVPCLPGTCTLMVRSTFDGLAHGVLVENSMAVRPFQVVQADFTNCYRGITSLNSPGGTMLFNEFRFGDVPLFYSDVQAQIGIYLGFDHPGFELQENEFIYEAEGETKAIGITCNGIGGEFNFIRRNEFTGLDIAHEAFGMNALNEDVSGGLIYLCELISDTPEKGFDFLLNNSQDHDNIYMTQGEFIDIAPFLLPAGNNFAYTGTDLHNEGDEIIDYFYYDAGNQEPRTPHYGFTKENLQEPNPCSPQYCVPPCMDGEDIINLKEDYPIYRAAYAEAVADYWEAIDNEQASEAEEYRRIAAYNLRSGFKSAYDILSHAWRDTLNFDIDTLIKWYQNLDAYGGDIMVAAEIARDGRMSEAIDSLEAIPLRRELTTLQEQDLENIIGIYNLLDTTDIPDLSVTEKSVIRSIAQSDIGTSSGIARAILSYHGERHPLPYYLGELNDPPIRYRESKEDEGAKNSQLVILPIPASTWITIDWDIPSDISSNLPFSIVDIHGRVVYSEDVQFPVSLDVSQWHPGVYLGRTFVGSRSVTTKFIVR